MTSVISAQCSVLSAECLILDWKFVLRSPPSFFVLLFNPFRVVDYRFLFIVWRFDPFRVTLFKILDWFCLYAMVWCLIFSIYFNLLAPQRRSKQIISTPPRRKHTSIPKSRDEHWHISTLSLFLHHESHLIHFPTA